MWKTMDEATLKSKKVAELKEIAKTFGLKGYEKMRKAELIAALMIDDAPKELEQAAAEAPKNSAETVETPVEEVSEAEKEDAPEEAAPEEEKKQRKRGRRGEGRKGEAHKGDSHKGTRVTKGDKVPDQVVPDKDDRYEAEGILDMAEDGFGFLRFNNFLTSDKDIYVAPAQIRRFNLKTGDKVKGICRPPKGDARFGALLYVVSVNDEEPGAAIRRPDFNSLTPIFPREKLVMEDVLGY